MHVLFARPLFEATGLCCHRSEQYGNRRWLLSIREHGHNLSSEPEQIYVGCNVVRQSRLISIASRLVRCLWVVLLFRPSSDALLRLYAFWLRAVLRVGLSAGGTEVDTFFGSDSSAFVVCPHLSPWLALRSRRFSLKQVVVTGGRRARFSLRIQGEMSSMPLNF